MTHYGSDGSVDSCPRPILPKCHLGSSNTCNGVTLVDGPSHICNSIGLSIICWQAINRLNNLMPSSLEHWAKSKNLVSTFVSMSVNLLYV